MVRRLTNRLFESVDIAPLVFFRIAFGALMLWEVWRYFYYDRISRYYVEPTFFFHYYGFEWLKPLPGDGMFLLFHGLGLLSVAIMLGAFYRLSMALFCAGFTYVFLLDQAQYLNHFYLVSLYSFLMIFVPAHRALSVDVWLRPAIRSQVAPAWSLWLLRGQMAVVYVFGGLAKLNPDWLVGEPLRMWLAERTNFPLIGHLFTEEWMVYLFSYGGLLLDLLIVPLLLWQRTRIPSLVLATAFHLTNARLFNIGIFPWFAIAATLIFMPPEWFRLGRPRPQGQVSNSRHGWVLVGIGVYFAIQIVLPLRHWLYPGDPSWTEEGHTLAWHMRLRQKEGQISLYAGDAQAGTLRALDVENMLSERQYSQMKDNPDMILRLVHYLGDTHGKEVRAWSMMSLNNRAPQLLIDPTADLTRQRDDLLAADWILPLVQLPYPHEPVPALLVSRRAADALVLINITESVYSLGLLRLQAGGHTVLGIDFGVTELMPGECLLAHTQDADQNAVLVPCNESGSRLLIDAALLTQSLQINTTQTCTGPVCVVTDEA